MKERKQGKGAGDGAVAIPSRAGGGNAAHKRYIGVAPAPARPSATPTLSGQPLPHFDAIQESFGRYGVGNVTARMGGEAAKAADAIGAEAYASGNDVAFQRAPSLHTAAHEAAHVVQQRGGVQLKGDVGVAGEMAGGSAPSAVQSTAVQREAAPPNSGPAPETKPQQKSPLVEALIQRAQTPGVIRAALAADPTLGAAIQGFFAAGNDDPKLNGFLALAFPPSRRSATNTTPDDEKPNQPKETISGKAGTGAGATLPATRADNKVLSKGTFNWSLSAETTSRPKFTADFKPDHTKVEAKAVSFAQTVIQQQGATQVFPGGTRADPTKDKAKYTPFLESTDKKYIDHHPGTENDPYYGAEWDQAGKKWKKETTPGSAVGSSKKGASSTSAKMLDRPEHSPITREGKGAVKAEFETVALVLETREPLGALKWGCTIADAATAPLVLTGAKKADCTESPSAVWGAAMTKFYEGKFETILDNFDIAKHTLKADHKTKLDSVVTKMKAKPTSKVQLGGACDLTGNEKFNQKLALKRAEAARDYLVTKGIGAARIEIQSYSFDWARVEAKKGKSEGKNRRVQVLLR